MSSSNEEQAPAEIDQGKIGKIQDRMKYLLETGVNSDVEFLVGKESLGEEPKV